MTTDADDDGAAPRRYVKRRLAEIGRSQRWLAERMGISAPGLSHLLAGRRDLSLAEAAALAHHLGTDLVALAEIFGLPVPSEPPTLAVTARIGDDGAVHAADPRRAPRVPAPPGRPTAEAARVDTATLRPRYQPGDILYLGPPEPPAAVAGREAVITLADGSRVLRHVAAATADGRATLVSAAAVVETDAPASSAARVLWIAPAP